MDNNVGTFDPSKDNIGTGMVGALHVAMLCVYKFKLKMISLQMLNLKLMVAVVQYEVQVW